MIFPRPALRGAFYFSTLVRKILSKRVIVFITANRTATEIYNAYNAGKNVLCRWGRDVLQLVFCNETSGAFAAVQNLGDSNEVVNMAAVWYSGETWNVRKYLLPTSSGSLKNPNALTFTGAVSGTYDGSKAVEINIPEGGSGESVEEVLVVKFTYNSANESYSADKTSDEIYSAYLHGRVVIGYVDSRLFMLCIAPSSTKMTFVFNSYQAAFLLHNGAISGSSDTWFLTEHYLADMIDIPKALKNPNALTFTGAVTGTYDGSSPLTVDIPQGTPCEKGDKGDPGTSVTVSSVNESTADGGSNIVTFSDGKTLTVKNGSKGSPGATGAQGLQGLSTFVRFSASHTGDNMTETWSSDQSYIGIATALSAPTEASAYTWCLFINPYTPSGWMSSQITMLETIFKHLVYTDTETSTIVDALISSLRTGETVAPTLDKLVVSYDNSTAVAAGTTLSALGEIVKAQYTDGTQTAALAKDTDYELSGSLTPGQTNTITVTGKGGYAGLAAVTFNVTVKAAVVSVTGVSVSPTAKTITAGVTFTITATISPSNATNKNVTWTSTAPSVASVTGNGLTATVNALTTGSATIKAVTADGSHEATCEVTVEAASAAKHSITYDSTVDGVQTVTFNPMPTEVDEGTSTTINMTAGDLSASYYSKATVVAMNTVVASSAKIGNSKTTGTNSISISNQTDDAEISAVPTTFFPSTNQAYADGTAYAPVYAGGVPGGCSRLYELKEGKRYVYTPPASITTTYRIIFVRADKTAMGATSEQRPAAGAVTIPYSGSTSGGTASVTIPSDAKYFFIRHSSSLKTADEQEVFANNAKMLLENV